MSLPFYEYPVDEAQMTAADWQQLSDWESFNSPEHDEPIIDEPTTIEPIADEFHIPI